MMLIQIKLNNIYWRKVYEILQKYAIIYDALGNSCDPQFHGFKKGWKRYILIGVTKMAFPEFSKPSMLKLINRFSVLPIVLLFWFVVSGHSIKPLHGIGSNNRTCCTVVASLFAERRINMNMSTESSSTNPSNLNDEAISYNSLIFSQERNSRREFNLEELQSY